MNSRNAVVNLQPGTSIPVIRVSQYDVGVTLNFIVYDGNEPASFASGTTVTIQATRPSSTGFVQNCTLSGNVVTVDTVIAMTQEYGRMQAELRFVNGSTDVGTGNFVYIVEKAAHADDTIDADVNQWTELAQQVHADTVQSTQNATIANEAKTSAQNSADTASRNADIAVKAATSAGQASDTAVSAKEAAEAAASTAETTVANTVRFDISQAKTDAQKLQARNNAGSAGVTSLAPAYSASSTYAVGDMVTQDGKLYKCSTAIETVEAWTAGHWTEVAVGNEIINLKDDLINLIDGALNPSYANLDITNGGYYTVSAIDGSLNLNIDNTNTYAYTTMDVNGNDLLLISLRHTTVNDSIIFIDESNNVVQYYMKRNENSQTIVNKEYTVPVGATKVCLTTTIIASISVVVCKPITLNELNNDLRKLLDIKNTIEDYIPLSFVTNANSNFVVSADTGKLIQNNSQSTSFISTNIPCVEGEKYKISFRHTALLDSVVVADKHLNAILTLYPRSMSESINITDLSVKIPQNGVLLCVSSTNAVPITIKKASTLNLKKIIVAQDGTGDYIKISDAILSAGKNTEIYVKPGNYDLIIELGSTYFDNYIWNEDVPNYGITMPEDSKLIFSSGAKVICNYTGNNNDIKEQWSPLASNKGDVEFISVVIEASNVKYCIHEEHGGYDKPYKVLFDNCNLYLNDVDNPLAYSKSCIGGGLGWYGDIEVKNCIFESVGTSTGGTVSYHTQVGGNGSKCKVNIHNNYFVGNDNTIRVYSAYNGTGSQTTFANINNNSLGKDYITDNIVKSRVYLNEVRN